MVLSGCMARPTRHALTPSSRDTVTLLDHGWHTDIGVPADELSGPLAMFRDVFPGARSMVFSFGKKTFLMAPAHDSSEYLLGPVPGPAAIMVTGLSVPSENAYGADPALVLHLPEGGAARLSDFIWREILQDRSGKPRLIDRGAFSGSLFYAATAGYGLDHTCNTWSALVLAATGLDINPSGVVFASQIMARARLVSSHPPVASTSSP